MIDEKKWEKVEETAIRETRITKRYKNIVVHDDSEKAKSKDSKNNFVAELHLWLEFGETEEESLAGLRKTLAESIESIDELLEGGK